MKAEEFLIESSIDDNFDFVIKPKRGMYAFPKGVDQSDKNNAAGWLGLSFVSPGVYEVADVLVHPEYKRQGLATAMYQKMIDTGIRLVRSNEQRPDGSAMWAGFAKKGLARNREFVGKN